MTIERATRAHAEALASVMRAEDIAEAWAWSLKPPLEALLYSMESSAIAWTALIDGEVASIFGVGPSAMDVEKGVVWHLSGSVVDKHPIAYARVCRPVVWKLLEVFPTLVNAVDGRYEKAQRWLRWLGFQLGEPFLKDGVSFLPFEMKAGTTWPP